MIGKMFKSLFGGTGEGKKVTSKAAEVTYEDFRIIAEPTQAGGQWQVSGRIEKQVGETVRSHTFIRADTLPDQESAANEMIRKAKLMIDQLGDQLFD